MNIEGISEVERLALRAMNCVEDTYNKFFIPSNLNPQGFETESLINELRSIDLNGLYSEIQNLNDDDLADVKKETTAWLDLIGVKYDDLVKDNQNSTGQESNSVVFNSGKTALENIRIGDHLNEENPFLRVVLDFSSEQEIGTLSELDQGKDSHRFYIDLPGAIVSLDGNGTREINQGGIKKVRYAENNNNLRIVLDVDNVSTVQMGTLNNDGKTKIYFDVRTEIRSTSIVNATTLSAQGAAFIANYEQFSSSIYVCDGGKSTIGYGHVIKAGESYPNGITKDQALVLFKSDTQWAIDATNKQITVSLNQHQFDAVVSLIFNIGPGAPSIDKGFYNSYVRRSINNGNRSANIVANWKLFKYAGGRSNNGLINRRKDETELFVNGDYIRNY